MSEPQQMVQAHLANMEADANAGFVDLPRISAQQRHYVAARVGGMGVAAAAAECGAHRKTATNWEKDARVQAHVDHYLAEFSEKVLPRVQFSLETAHMMYMNAYHSAGSAGEMVKATDSLVKLHGLLDKKEGDRGLPNSAKQLEGMSSQELLRLAAIGMDTLHPGDIIDGEFEDVPNEEGPD